MKDTFRTKTTLTSGGRSFSIARIPALDAAGLSAKRLPFSLRVLLENLLRHEDGVVVTAADIEALVRWNPTAEPDREIAFTPARVLMQDFTGVPAVVDLAAMRAAMATLGGDPRRINPLLPTELVIDHSVQVDAAGTPDARAKNTALEFARNGERYTFLRWGQKALANFKVVPPETGIVHQVNLEFLARVVMESDGFAYPDTVVGTDSHTTMINGLGVLGWGVGGIEAEAAMLGQPVSMLIPQVVGFRLSGKLREGVTATDLVLTVTEILRKKNVVNKFVEFFGPGMPSLPLADRATIANMAPEYGATCGIFPVDEETLRYLALSGRSKAQIDLVRDTMVAQGMFHTADAPQAEYSEVVALDLDSVEPSLAGPKRPQDRVRLADMKTTFHAALPSLKKPGAPDVGAGSSAIDDTSFELRHGGVVIAAITSCTNTSNPSVLIAAGLVAKKAAARGLTTKPWVKTSLAPGSRVVTSYLEKSGLLQDLEALRFHVVGYGCTTCIGNSGPLHPAVGKVIQDNGLVVSAVLSGNRNFEGRVHPDVRANYLASPPLVVAYAIAGTADIDLTTEPLGVGRDGRPVFLKDVWPTQREVAEVIERVVGADLYRENYASVFEGGEAWRKLPTPEGDLYAFESASTYVKLPPYFDGMTREPKPFEALNGARILAIFGDSVTTDHISPAGDISKKSPAAAYLVEHGVAPADFNSYGARRGNHEVMMRGTFANTRIKNLMLAGVEGGMTAHQPSGAQMSIYDAAMRYRDERVPLVVFAGKEYGTGSSRDWAAKGPALLGVRAVVAESFERIHRTNLVCMGIVPLQFEAGQNAQSVGLKGDEIIDIDGLVEGLANGFKTSRNVTVRARAADGRDIRFAARVRIDTPQEMHYVRHGGILRYVLRRLASS
jgi:aconitate hydratase